MDEKHAWARVLRRALAPAWESPSLRISYQPAPSTRFNFRHDEYLSIPHSIYHPILYDGDATPRGELASLGQESAIDNRGGILDFSPPPRMVDLSPVDQVSIDMPPRKDVSAYDTMIGEHNSPYKIPTYPAGRDARDRPISSDLAITRTRDGLDCGTRGLIAAVCLFALSMAILVAMLILFL
ncbi:hypothetical protein H4Q26_010199 [Puccinia striiformis f. sp. tritici PST-130]|nr:hypothetical protein H4Q26_010199 [Puccinia striiformis f. sp. tritici PST-130]